MLYIELLLFKPRKTVNSHTINVYITATFISMLNGINIDRINSVDLNGINSALLKRDFFSLNAIISSIT